MNPKDNLHQLVDVLDEGEVDNAVKFVSYLIYLRDPIFKALRDAPEDDELETEKEKAAMKEAYEDVKSGNIISSDKILDEI